MNNELPDNLNIDKRWLYQLAASLPLTEQALENGLRKLGVIPDQQQWKNWLIIISVGLGAALFLSGVIFFFAYNWESLHRFVRFSILGIGVISSAFAAYKFGLDKLPGKLLITASSVLTGVLLAVFGMVYQTGADSYQLFASWAAVILPWVIAARFQPLWLIWLLLINIAVIRWLGITNFGWFSGFDTFRNTMHIAIFINAAVLITREATKLIHSKPETGRWFPGLVAWFLLSALSWVPVEVIFDGGRGKMWQGLLLMYFVTISSMSYYYLKVRHDLFMLVLCMVSAIIVLTSGFIKVLFHQNGEFGAILLVGLFIIAETTVATKLILYISRRWKAEENNNEQ